MADGEYFGGKIHVFNGLQGECEGLCNKLCRKIKMIASPLPSSTWLRRRADASLQLQDLCKMYDVVVLEGIEASANFEPESGVKYVYISHNNEVRSCIDNWAASKISMIRLLDIAKTVAWEREIVKHANQVLSVSQSDTTRLKALNISTEYVPSANMLNDVPDLHRGSNREAIFLGAPAFPPNAEAISWILNELIPFDESDILYGFIGCDEDQVRGLAKSWDSVRSRVRCYGFVENSVRDAIMDNALLMICPVVLGSGVKGKIMDALSRGLPVLASLESSPCDNQTLEECGIISTTRSACGFLNGMALIEKQITIARAGALAFSKRGFHEAQVAIKAAIDGVRR